MLLAHLSDLHAFTLDGARPWHWLTKRTAGYVNLLLNRRDKHPLRLFEAAMADLNRRPVDEVVVTGDLTSLSLPGEFRLARGFLDRLTLGNQHVTLVPGNHDVYTLDAMWSRPFAEAFAPYVTSDSGRAGYPLLRRRGELSIVGLSTARPSPVPLADGWVGASQLAALEEMLDAERGHFRVVLLHHPPNTNRHSILRGLRDRGALQKVLARVGCELVLHGHEHRDVRTELRGPDGAIPVIGVASGTYADERADRRARYNVYRIEGGKLVDVETRLLG